MKIAFLWFWDRASEIMPNWRDGYRAAIEEVEKKHDVHWFVDEKLPENDGSWDFIWIWGDSNCPAIKATEDFHCRKGLSLTTDPTNFENLRKLDVIFVESDPIYNAIRRQGMRAIKAFGTDTDYFRPKGHEYDDSLTKGCCSICGDHHAQDVEYFYPATFSPWKQQSVIAPIYKDKLLCVGTIQPDGDKELQACKDNGVQLEIGYFPVDKIRDYYWRTKQVVIPAVHGSERTVLECMSMNIPVEVTSPANSRAKSYINEFQQSGFTVPRDFVIDKYSHITFAEQLLKGIEQ